MSTAVLAADDQLLVDSHDLDTTPLNDERDGVTHSQGKWPLDTLPCAWRSLDVQVSGAAAAVDMPRPRGIILSSRAPAREAFPRTVCVYQADVRRAALAALECCGATAGGASRDARLAYFKAKAAVDDAARSDEALAVLVARLQVGEAPRFVDLGAGTLSLLPTLARAAKAAGFETMDYVAVDRDRAALRAGLAKLEVEDAPWLQDADPLATRQFDKLVRGTCDIDGVQCTLSVVAGDALDADAFGAFDVVCGNAFADLIRPEILADRLRRLGKPGGTAYLPITFAGTTELEPRFAGSDELLRAYDEHLDEDQKQYTDVARLVQILERNECTILSRDSSDWRVPLDGPFAPYLKDFVGLGAVPRFFGGPKALDAVRWARALQKQRSGAFVVRNVDLVVGLPAEEIPETRGTRSHRRGDSLTQLLDLARTKSECDLADMLGAP